MTTEDSLGSSAPSESVASKTENPPDSLSSQRVFKKTSPNSKLTMYLSSRDLVVSAGRIDRLTGVLLVDPEFAQDRKVYGQVTLTFRYGREDEEVMGLKFCNEAIMCLAQLYPPHPAAQPPEGNTPLQDALLKRLGPNAYPFSMEITPLAPPSVQLVPAKEYNGAPIGTSYDVRAYIADRADEKLHRRGTVRMGIRVVQRAFAPPPPSLYNAPGAAGGVSGIGGAGQQHHRLTLFGCRSVPVDHKFRPVSGGVMDLADGKSDGKRVDIELQPLRRGSSHGVLAPTDVEKTSTERNAVPESNNEEERQVSCHVSFKEQVVTSVVDLPENNDEDMKPSEVLIDDRPVDEAADGSDKQREKEKESQITDQFRSLCGGKRPSLAAYLAGVPPPQAAVEKPFLLSDGKVYLAASLDKAIYSHGEEIHVSVHVRNQSNKTVRRIKVFIVQHVDVCMFSNGKFKNVVAMINSKDDCPISPAITLDKTFTLLPIKSSTKNWIALEDSYTKAGSSLASTVTCTAATPEDRNVFAIYVSYYVKVKLFVTLMGGEVSLKLPFTLMHTCSDFDHTESLTRVKKPDRKLSESRGDGKCEPEGT